MAAILFALAAVTTAVIWPIVREPPPSVRPPPAELPQYYVLSPTNGILKRYLVTEGEHVTKHASLALMGSADHEQRVRDARTAVARARLALEEARLEATVEDRSEKAGGGNAAAGDRSQAKRDQQAIRDQEQHVRELSIAVTTAQAKLVAVRSQPFGREGNATAIDAAEADLTRLQSKLDVANIELKQRRRRAVTRMTRDSDAAAVPHESTAVDRRISGAAAAMQHEQNKLIAIEEEGAQFTSTIPAPFGGQVIRILRPKGSFIREGQPIVVLMRQP